MSHNAHPASGRVPWWEEYLPASTVHARTPWYDVDRAPDSSYETPSVPSPNGAPWPRGDGFANGTSPLSWSNRPTWSGAEGSTPPMQPPWYGGNGSPNGSSSSLSIPWHPSNGDAWGMFLFGGPQSLMEHWMEQMARWGNMFNPLGNRVPTMPGGNTWNTSISPNAIPTPSMPMDVYDPTLEPWIDRWGER